VEDSTFAACNIVLTVRALRSVDERPFFLDNRYMRTYDYWWMNKYTRNDNWNVQYENKILLLNAGSDHLYAVTDLEDKVANEILDLWKTNFEQPLDLSNRAREILEELKSAGIVHIKVSNNRELNFDVKYLGNNSKSIYDKVARIIEADGALNLCDSNASDFTLFLRTNCGWKDILDVYECSKPHLLVDVSYHHTVSLGPLVVPPETACLGCLVGRITNLWGDPSPPASPKIQENENLIASMIVMELKKIAENDQSLINRTVSFNFKDYKVQSDTLYKLPWCPYCGQKEEHTKAGSIEIPWVMHK
jgi:bacteriocin biosynthesis cyclodehydratase domain-containing protein